MKFTLSGNLLRFTNFRTEIEVKEPTVEKCLEGLVRECPELKPVLMDADGRCRHVHRLFLNGDLLKFEEMGRGVSDQDECSILTAIAGG